MSAVAELRELGLSVADLARLSEAALAEQGHDLWIYAIQADGYGGDIKIGISRDPHARLATLQVGNSKDLRGIAAWRAFPEEEKSLHEHWASSLLRGEWFMHSLPMYRYLKDRGGRFEWR